MTDKISPQQESIETREHFYHGHRAQSFYISRDNDAELVEIRARQRTFDGAAYRTAMGNLSYAIVILKLFDTRFYRSKFQLFNCLSIHLHLFLVLHNYTVGILYTVLSIVLFILAYSRSQRSKHDFADIHQPVPVTAVDANVDQDKRRPLTQRSGSKKIFGRAFKTAGWSVIAVSSVVFAVEVALFVLILDL